MSEFAPDLPAAAVDARLRAAVADLRRAPQNAVLWFAELMRRRLYRDCGYASIHAYAEAVLGFSRNKSFQFIRLAESLDRLPGLRDSLSRGELSWTKAREVVKVATPESESRWLAEASRLSSRALEARVKACRPSGRALHAETLGQSTLLPGSSLGLPVPTQEPATPAATLGAVADSGSRVQGQATETVLTLTLRLSPLQIGRLEALQEKIRKRSGGSGRRQSREEMLIAGLEALLTAIDEADSPARCENGKELPRGNSTPPYQVVIYRCEDCGAARLPDGRALAPAVAAQAACDCRTHRVGETNRASIPLGLRRAVLARDGHRCQAPGCRATRFLEVHHRRPREHGGTNEAANLITLCAACHRLLHKDDGKLAAALPAAGLSIPR
ncbi:HNH endonuclease [bacterium]|nr:HNH endonuclease [bacterium]